MSLWRRLTKSKNDRWDSSDPDRAPPPLPLNPQSPSLTSRAGTSRAIQSAHAALNERARESAALAPPYTKRSDQSPERSLVKGGSGHRRTQTLQSGSVRDLSLMIESAASSPKGSPTKSPDKFHHQDRTSTPPPPRRRDTDKDGEGAIDSPFFDQESVSTGPMPGPSLTPIIRPTVRRPGAQSILGENTPPQSSTMMALQSMGSHASRADSEPPLSNITNGSTGPSKQPQSIDQLSSQILSLTSIATSLQKEMSALSRRSRDNATDLLSLKEATNTRDEDIRKSLKDLLGSVTETSNRLSSKDFGSLLLDNKPHAATSPNSRPFQLPRIPSPKSFSESIDRGSMSTPSLVGGDHGASIPLLERIIRDMGTKEGQDNLVSRLTEVSQKLSGMATASKVDELLDHIRTQSSHAIVPRNNKSSDRGRQLGYENGGDRSEAAHERGRSTNPISQRVEMLLHAGEGRTSSVPGARGSELLNEDLIKIIRSVKDSVAQGGGLTAEVKALVRELRGEVLGMGRELGKKLEQIGRKGIEDTEPPSKDEVSRVIDEGLEQMKDQLNHVLREHRRQSAQSAATSKTLVDYQEIYNAMRTAIRDNEASRSQMPDLSRDDVIEAVRDAWENYKPEIEVQQIGLERDEVLACLKEGLQEYAPRDERPAGATRDEVFTAVVEGLKHFVPPQMDTPASVSRDEIIEAVRDCLEEFEFPVAASAVGADITREDMVHAVKEGLSDLDLPRNNALVPHGQNDEIVGRLEDLMGYIKMEFQAVSQEAKDNVAANGRDTEQVLDATKDGFDNLRIAIESYVDRATGATGQEEFMQGLLRSLEDFKEEVSGLVAQATEGSREQLQTELEGLREVVNSSMVPAMPQQGNNKEILEALHSAVGSLRQEILRPRSETGEILDALNDGLNDLRAGIDRVTNKPVDLTANDEILDALKSGLDSVRSDIESMRGSDNDQALAAVGTSPSGNDEILDALKSGLDSVRADIETIRETANDKAVAPIANDEILDALRSGLESVRSDIEGIRESNNERAVAAVNTMSNATPEQAIIPADMVKQDDIKNLEVLITELRIKIEAMEPETDSAHKEGLTRLEDMLRNVQQSVEEIGSREVPVTAAKAETTSDAPTASGDAASKEDVEAIETILRNTKARLDDLMDGEQAVRKENLEAVEALILETRESMSAMADQMDAVSRKDDLSTLESLITQIKTDFDEMKDKAEKENENPEKVTKTDVEAVETVVLEIKNILDVFEGVDLKTLPQKEDLANIEAIVKEAKDKLDSYNESQTMAIEKRQEDIDQKQEELSNVSGRVGEVKTFLEEFQETLKGKLDEGTTGVEALGKLLETMGEKIDKNENVGTDLKEMFETMKSEFEDSRGVVAGAKLESDEKLQQATDSISTKIDDKVSELITKYEEFQAAYEEKSAAGEARSAETEAAVVGTKAVADELKLLIDTLGSTVTDSLEKMEEASRTVFDKVEELVTRNDENHTEGKAEHEQTRGQLQQAVTLVESLQGEVSESHPKILESIKEVLELVGQHFEHSKTSTTDIQDKIVEAKPPEQPLLPPPEKYDDSEVQQKLDALVELKYDDTELREKLELLVQSKYDDTVVNEKLDKLVEWKYDDSVVNEKLDKIVDEYKYDDTVIKEKLDQLVEYNGSIINEKLDILVDTRYDDSAVKEKLDQLAEAKYDDTVVNEKLDKLVTHSSTAEQAFTQLETLDKVHQSVVKTAADISEFLSTQKQRLADEHEDREKTLQETTLAVERKRSEKDHLEASVLSLKDEEDRIRKSIMSLRTEQESLIRQKTRLTGDVSSLETAMHLRKEELSEMESRAERLERRILEGVMDHSRVLLMSKATKSGGDTMNRKRVRKPANEDAASARPTSKPVMNIALAGKRHLALPGQTGAGRRIASLGQIHNNISSSGVKRSNSVRTPAGGGANKSLRKRSWGGDLGFVETDKENISVRETVEEVDENESPSLIENDGASEATGDDESDTGTLRRSSLATRSTDLYTESEAGYSEYDETASEWTESVVSSSVAPTDDGTVDVNGNEMVVYGS